jgi:hypothetical protein
LAILQISASIFICYKLYKNKKENENENEKIKISYEDRKNFFTAFLD